MCIRDRDNPIWGELYSNFHKSSALTITPVSEAVFLASTTEFRYSMVMIELTVTVTIFHFSGDCEKNTNGSFHVKSPRS